MPLLRHQTGLDYWKDATVETLTNEFIGQRDILNMFSLIPIEAMKGTRAPFLQMAGDNTYQMLTENNLDWDCSWPTNQFTDPPMWPYTLDYTSNQECPIPPCPESTFPGKWVVPMVDWSSDDGIPCSMVDTCPLFLDYLATLPDVYIVSVSQMLEWVKSPTPISTLKELWKCWEIPEENCKKPRNCELIRQDNGETRYMSSCVTCPDVYPWLNNTSGKKE
ncbi:chitin deacetylase 7-like [Hetaerina americana]|uniref:chitin deacetylase 7-like n=1 Tax=Hetaerina americana TaxID=62018 RepID=UPI003A7F5F26